MYWLYIFFSIFGIFSRTAYSQVVSTLVTSNFEGDFKSELAVDSRIPLCSSQADYMEYSTSPEPEPSTRIFAFLRTGFSILDDSQQFTQTQEIKNLVWTDTNGVDHPVVVDEIKEVSCGVSVHALKISYHLSGETYGLRIGIVVFLIQYSDHYHLAGKTVKGAILNTTTTASLSGLNFGFVDRLRIAGQVRSPDFTTLEIGTIQSSLILNIFTSALANDILEVTVLGKQIITIGDQGSSSNQLVILEKAKLQGLYANGSSTIYLWGFDQGAFTFTGTVTAGTSQQKISAVKCAVSSWRFHQDPTIAQDCYISFEDTQTPAIFNLTRFTFNTSPDPTFTLQSSTLSSSPVFGLLPQGTSSLVFLLSSDTLSPTLQLWSLPSSLTSLTPEPSTQQPPPATTNTPQLLAQSPVPLQPATLAWDNLALLPTSHPTGVLTTPDTSANRNTPAFVLFGRFDGGCSVAACAVCDSASGGCAVCAAAGGEKVFLYRKRCFGSGTGLTGVRTSGVELVTCADPYCTVCGLLGSLEVCQKCGLDETGQQRYLDPQALDPKLSCLSREYVKSTILSRGINLLTGELSECSSGCLSCPNSHLVCEKCSDPLVLVETTASCVPRESVTIVPSTGITDSFPFTFGSCFVSQCQSCAVRSVCQECTPNNLLFPSGFCLPEATPLALNQGKAQDGDKSILDCKIGDCADCHLDATTCPVCKLGHVLSQADTPSACVLQSNPVPLIGKGNDGFWTKPCQDPQCDNCWEDWQICTRCKPGQNGEEYFVDSKSSACVRSLTGSGRKTGNTTQLFPCDALGCSDCAADVHVCSRCSDGLLLLVQPGESTECIPSETKLPGFGLKDTFMVVPCQTTGCLECSEDYLTCARCMPGAYLYNNTCYLEIFNKAGVNPDIPWTLEDCVDQNCLNCSIDYQKCTACDNNRGFYLFQDPRGCPVCLNESQAPPGYGIDLVSNQFSACSIADCASCLVDFRTQCELCKPGRILQKHTTPGGVTHSCISTDSVPSGWGWKLNTYEIVPCLDPNCLECVDDHRTCKQCAAEFLILMKDFSCVSGTNIPDRYGMLGADQKLVPCSTTHCKKCAKDYQSCFECEEGFGLVKGADIHSTICVLKAGLLQTPWIAPIGLISGFYGVDKSTLPVLEFVLCQDPSCYDCLEDHSICMSCLANSTSPVLERANNTCISRSWVPAPGFGFDQSSSPNTTIRCSDQGCLECPAYYQSCIKCDQPNGFFLYELTQDCYTMNTLPNRTGLKYSLDTNGQKIAVGTIELCRDTACAQCKLNSDVCERCDTAFFLDSRTFTCFARDLIPNYVGPKTDLMLGDPQIPEDSLLLGCTVGACRNCSQFYQRCFECDSGTFLTVDNLSCVSANLIPLGQGILTTNPGTLAACAVVGCTNCSLDASKCSVCSPGRFYSTQQNTCSPCRTVGCQSCDASGDTCLQCYPEFKYYQENLSGGRTCLASLPDKYGLDITDISRQRVSPCTDVGCANCSTNFRKCSSCSVGYVTQTLTDRVSCLPKIEQATEIPDGYGRDSATNTLKPCAVSRCMNCKTDFQICETCSTDMVRVPLFRYLELSGSVRCLFITEIPPGNAIDSLNNTVVPCSDALCASCLFNKSQCTACLAGSYLNRLASGELKCIPDTPAQNIPKGYGPTSDEERNVQGLPDYMPCAQKYCKECSVHYTRCSRCSLDTFLVSDMVPTLAGKCLKYSAIPEGYSINSVLQVVPCADPRCKACSKSDPSICTTCMDDQYFFKMPDSSVTCLGSVKSSVAIPPGSGFDGTMKELKPCHQSDKCEICEDSYLHCNFCKPTNPSGTPLYLNPQTGLCHPPSEIPDTLGIAQTTSPPTLSACSTEHCLRCRSDAHTCTACDGDLVLHLNRCVPAADLTAGVGRSPLFVEGAAGAYYRSSACRVSRCEDCREDSAACVRCRDACYWLRNAATGLIDSCLPTTEPLDPRLLVGPSPGSGSMELSPCTDENCVDCTTDNSKCKKCDRNTYLYQGVCVESTQKLTSIGKSHTLADGNLLLPCADALCGDCWNYYAYCTECLDRSDVVGFWKASSHHQGITCLLTSELPSGMGTDVDTGLVTPCLSARCADCASDFRICKTCSDPTDYYFVEDSQTNSISCYPQATSIFGRPIGRQAAPDQKELKACRVQGCLNCAQDWAECSRCKPGYVYTGQISPNTPSCLDYTEASQILGVGLVVNTTIMPTLSPCQIENCMTCTANADQECTSCKVGYFLLRSSPKPICVSAIPEGFGKSQANPTVLQRCDDILCLKCEQNPKTCTACKTPLKLVQGVCSEPGFPLLGTNLGIDRASQSVGSCADPGCADCRDDTRFCRSCLTTFALNISDLEGRGSCYPKSNLAQLPNGIGLSMLNNSLEKCLINNCKNCSSDFESCELCQENFELRTSSGQVICEASISVFSPTLVSLLPTGGNNLVAQTKTDPSSNTAVVSFDRQVPSYISPDKFYCLAYDSTTGELLGPVKISKVRTLASNKHVLFEFATDQSSMVDKSVTLYLRTKAAQGNSRILLSNLDPFALGITLKNIVLTSTDLGASSLQIRLIRYASIAILVVFVLGFLVSLYASQAHAFRLINYQMTLVALTVISADIPVAELELLGLLDWSVLSFIPLPAAGDDSLKCVPPAFLYFRGYSCFIYDNIRKFLIFLTLLIFLKVVSAIRTFIVESQQAANAQTNPNSVKSRRKTTNSNLNIPKLLDTYLNSTFFFNYFWCVLPVWVTFSLINLYIGSASGLVGFGMILSILVLLVYFALATLALQPNPANPLHKSLRTELAASFQIHQGIKSAVPALFIIRGLLLSAMLVFVQDSPIGQLAGLTAVFALSAGYLWKVGPYFTKHDNMCHATTETLFGIYAAAKLLTVVLKPSGVGLLPVDNVVSIILCAFVGLIIVSLVVWTICLCRHEWVTKHNQRINVIAPRVFRSLAASSDKQKSDRDKERSAKDEGEGSAFKPALNTGREEPASQKAIKQDQPNLDISKIAHRSSPNEPSTFRKSKLFAKVSTKGGVGESAVKDEFTKLPPIAGKNKKILKKPEDEIEQHQHKDRIEIPDFEFPNLRSQHFAKNLRMNDQSQTDKGEGTQESMKNLLEGIFNPRKTGTSSPGIKNETNTTTIADDTRDPSQKGFDYKGKVYIPPMKKMPVGVGDKPSLKPEVPVSSPRGDWTGRKTKKWKPKESPKLV